MINRKISERKMMETCAKEAEVENFECRQKKGKKTKWQGDKMKANEIKSFGIRRKSKKWKEDSKGGRGGGRKS